MKPMFSMPNQTVEKRIGQVKSKINPEVLKGKTDFEKMVLDQNDMTLQHGEILARSSDEQNVSLQIIQVQVEATNGRVNKHDERLAAHDRQFATYKTIGSVALFILPAIGIKLMDFVLTKVHF